MDKITVILTGREDPQAQLISVCQGHSKNVVMEFWGTSNLGVVNADTCDYEVKEVVYVQLCKDVIDNQRMCKVFTEGEPGLLGPVIAFVPVPPLLSSVLLNATGGGVYYWVKRKGTMVTFLGRADGFPTKEGRELGTVGPDITDDDKVWFRQVVMDLQMIQEHINQRTPEDIPTRCMATLERVIEHNQAVIGVY